jgi:signal transduction histidine kinase
MFRDFIYLIFVFLLSGFFVKKIQFLKKENTTFSRLFEKSESALGNFGRERNEVLKIFGKLNDGILAIDQDKKIFLINPAAKNILGVKTENLTGMQLKDFVRLSGAEFILQYLYSPNKGKKGTVFFRDLVIEVFASEGLIVLRDVTEESLVKKEKTDFLLSYIHQLKTSATSAKWSLKMFLSGDFGKISKEQKSVMEMLYKRNDDLISLVENLLSSIKIENGKYFYRKTLEDIMAITQSVVAHFKNEIKSKKIKFEFNEPGYNLPKIMVDREKMEFVLENLFDNSFKYTEKGGKVSALLEKDGKNIKFSIKDSGVGIPAKQQDKIFGKFFRAENANKINANGSGIGLFVAKKIIEDHHGKIWFESEEGKGSIFYFTLPIGRVE